MLCPEFLKNSIFLVFIKLAVSLTENLSKIKSSYEPITNFFESVQRFSFLNLVLFGKSEFIELRLSLILESKSNKLLNLLISLSLVHLL